MGRTLVEQAFYAPLKYVLFRTRERSQVRTNTHGLRLLLPADGKTFTSDSDHQSEMAFRFPQGDVENSVLSSYVRVKYIGTQIKSGFFSSKLFKKPLSYKHFKMTCNENTSKVDTNALDYLPFSLTHL